MTDQPTLALDRPVMTERYEFVVPIRPAGKARARVTRSGRQTYTPTKTTKAEGVIRLFAASAGVRPIEGPVSLTVDCLFDPPRSWSKKRRREAIEGACNHIGKPDADNVGKLVADALNGIAYKDDSQVAELIVRKAYDAENRIEIKISSSANRGRIND